MVNGRGGKRAGAGRKPKSYYEALNKSLAEREQQAQEVQRLTETVLTLKQEIAFLKQIITTLTGGNYVK